MSSLKSRFGLLVLLSAAGYAITFLSQLVIAYHFGTSHTLDSYWAGLALVGFLSFYMSPLKEALVPAVHRAQEQGNLQAGRVLSAGLSMLMALTFVSAAVLWFSAEGIASLLTSADEGTRGEVTALVPWLLPYLILLVLAETLNSTLISLNQVLRQSVVRIVAALVLLATVTAIGASLGVGGLMLAQILSMVTLIIASWLALRHLRLHLIAHAWPVLRESGMVPLFTSLLLTYFFAQLYVFIERSAMIHMGTGLVSAFQYSAALVNALVSLIAYPLANLLWSKFLAHAVGCDSKAALILATRACGILFYVLVVICVFAWVNAHDIVVLIYARGAFDEASINITTTALRATIFAAIPIGVTSVLGRWLISSPSAHHQLWIGLTTTAVGSLVIGVAVLVDSTEGIMLHWLIANLAAMIVSAAIFAYMGNFSLSQKLTAGYWLGRVAIVAILAAWITPDLAWGESKFSVAVSLVAQAGIYLLAIATMSWLFGIIPSLRRMILSGV